MDIQEAFELLVRKGNSDGLNGQMIEPLRTMLREKGIGHMTEGFPVGDSYMYRIVILDRASDYVIDCYSVPGRNGGWDTSRETAVRITHRQSGLQVECSSERSQWANKCRAMEQLQSEVAQWRIRK